MKRGIQPEEKKFQKKKEYTIEEILNLIDLNQKEAKNLKKTVPTNEKIKQEKIESHRDQRVSPKEQRKEKHISNKDEINEFNNIKEDSITP